MSEGKRSPKYWNKRGNGDEGPWDTIVIGSGIGGMTAAAMLAKAGQRVLVLEQHYVPGGFTHMFKRKGYTWDVGVHLVGEVTERSWTGRLLSFLTDGELRWHSMGEIYEEFYYPDQTELRFPNHPDAFRAMLLEHFPDEEQAIDRYFRYVRQASDAMKRHFQLRIFPSRVGTWAERLLDQKAQGWMKRSVQDVLEELTDNIKLRAAFSAQWGYYGSLPKDTPFPIQALILRHYWYGGYYPVGGSKRIADCLLKTVADAGGWTRISSPVEEILLEAGKAVGVKLQDGTSYKANAIISAIGMAATTQHLLPASWQSERWVQELNAFPHGAAHVCLYMGFKGDITKAGAGAANKWINPSWELTTPHWDLSDPDEIGAPPCLYCSFASLKDPEHDPGPEERHTGEIVTFVSWDDFAQWKETSWKKRGDAYEAFKETLTQRLLDMYFEAMPKLKPMLDYVELSTPLSTEHFCRADRGSMYGFAPTYERFQSPWVRPKSPIPGLYFGGSDVITGGVMSALVGGIFAAAAVAPLAIIKQQKPLMFPPK